MGDPLVYRVDSCRLRFDHMLTKMHSRTSIVAAFIMAVTANSATARPLDEVLASKRLFVVAYEDNRPFSWTQDDGTVTGINQYHSVLPAQ